jgi:hypothetical protein
MYSISVYNNLNNLIHSLNTCNFFNNKTNDYYSKKIILKSEISSDNKIHSFKSWLGTIIYGFYVDIVDNYNFIFSLDLIENDDNIKIEHISINNDYYNNIYEYYNNHYNYNHYHNQLLTDNEVLILKKSIFNFIEDFAISKNKTKIIIDIHQNMKRFNHELKDEGFVNSNNRCIDNYYWFEAVKEIKK